MCKAQGATVDVIPDCKPDWKDYSKGSGIEKARALGHNANECWKIFSKLFDNCGFKTAHVKTSVWSGFYKSAIMHDDKKQRTRVEYIVNEYIDVTVANREAREPIKSTCYRNALLAEFVDDQTLPDEEAKKAAERLAERLIKLMKKLGEKNLGPVWLE